MEFVTLRRAALPVLALMLAGCAGYTKRVDVNELPTGQDAYLFGRFYIDVPSSALAIDGHQSMGFAIECEDKQRYVLRFDRSKPLLAIKLKPSVCSWTETVYTNVDGSVQGRKPAPAVEFKNVTIAPGTAYYVGDFEAEGKTSVVGGTTSRTEWKLKRINNYFHRTSRDLGKDYPNLKALPIANKALFQGPPPKDDVSADIRVSEAEVRAEYDRLMAIFREPEFHARHILVATEAQAEVVRSRLAQKERFDVVAMALSEDSGSRKQGGDLGWGVPGNYTPPFADALRQLKPGQRTPAAIKSEFGWHFIEVLGMRELVYPDFEDAREGLTLRMRMDKAKKAAAPAAAASAVSAVEAAAAPSASAPAAPSAPSADQAESTKKSKKGTKATKGKKPKADEV